MKQVITKSGDKIQGLFRTDMGSLVVDDPIKFKRNQLELARAKEIDDIREEVREVKSALSEILNILRRNING